MRVALIGDGAVASVHARGLKKHAELRAVYGPERAKAEAFAAEHGVAVVAHELEAALRNADAAIVCSPSPMHFEQAQQVLGCGLPVLVEIPACNSTAQGRELESLAHSKGVTLQSTHTSRYLEPYRRLGDWLRTGTLGELRHIRYVRSIPPRIRPWTDDALLHHAEHPLDLLLYWFGSIEALGGAAHPAVSGAQDLALLGRVGPNAPLTISISYTTRLPEVKMTIAGAGHTVSTDGFSYIASDNPDLTWTGDEQQTYERAVEEQDAAFLKACREGEGGVRWEEAMKLIGCVEQFAGIA